jgi:oligoribonuclease (3'-5' exoribonuclease)
MRLKNSSKTRPTIEAATMIDLKQKYDASTVAVMRQALNEIVTDRRFLVRKSVTPLEVAEHILQQAASGERDLSRLKSSAFEKLSAAA